MLKGLLIHCLIILAVPESRSKKGGNILDFSLGPGDPDLNDVDGIQGLNGERNGFPARDLTKSYMFL